jgi:hypothetical protein
MAMSERDATRLATLRLAVGDGNVSASALAVAIRDVVGPAPRLLKAARELLGWDIETVARVAGIAAPDVRGCERAGGASARILCTLQLWFEGKGIRFHEWDFHGEYGVRLSLGWADDRRAIRAACALLGSPIKALAAHSGLSATRFEKLMQARQGIVPPVAARMMVARLENAGARFIHASPVGWAGIRAGQGEGVSL